MFGFTDLEEKLLGPEGNSERVRIGSALGEIGDTIREAVKSGLPHAEYNQANAILAAVAAAERIMIRAPLVKGVS